MPLILILVLMLLMPFIRANDQGEATGQPALQKTAEAIPGRLDLLVGVAVIFCPYLVHYMLPL